MYKNIYTYTTLYVVFNITIGKPRNNPNIHRQKTGPFILGYSQTEYHTTVKKITGTRVLARVHTHNLNVFKGVKWPNNTQNIIPFTEFKTS